LRSPGNKILILSSTALILFIVDQWSKYVIRTTPDLHRLTLIDGWLSFNFTKNPGMALGITWADTWIISLVAIVATFAIIYYISRTLKEANTGYLLCMGLIIGGALGNITDRIFMARIMGYGSWLDGHVVDFIHFTLEIGSYRVFPYIFNVADMGISIAIISLLIFGKWILPHDKPKEKSEEDGSGKKDTASGATQPPSSGNTPEAAKPGRSAGSGEPAISANPAASATTAAAIAPATSSSSASANDASEESIASSTASSSASASETPAASSPSATSASSSADSAENEDTELPDTENGQNDRKTNDGV
jgi:signal peptidase II